MDPMQRWVLPMRLALFLLGALGLVAACAAATPGDDTASSGASEEAIAAAVQATLTAVAQEPDAAADAPGATPTPASSDPVITLPAPVPNWESLADKPGATRGAPEAPVVLIEYSDFQCPWCLRFHQQVWPALEPLVESGDLRFVYKHFPILGEASVLTALASECALEQGDFWTLHDWLFANQSAWKGQGDVRERIVQAAGELGYDAQALDGCIDSEEANRRVGSDYVETQELGFRGTPSFVLNGRLIPGFLPAERFLELIQVFKAEALGEPLPEGYALAPTPPPPDLEFEPEEFAVDGDPQAPVVIVEFSDYQCPFCNRFFQETKPLLDEQYIATGQVRFVYKDFPIDNIHPQAQKAAEAAECAGAQGAYWAMHDRLFAGLEAWNNNPDAVAIFKEYAAELGLDTAQFNECLDQGRYAEEVRADREEGTRAQVTGTPTFFINGRRLEGAQPFSAFVQIIEEELAKSR